MVWHDNEILPGDKWREKISNNLADSDILLYLVSAASLASKNCNKELVEVKALNKIRVIPIILERCDWQNHQLSGYAVLPDKGKPINEWTRESTAWQNVVEGIRKAIDTRQSYAKASPSITQKEIEILALQYGNFLMMLEQIGRAMEAYSRAIELNPEYDLAYNNRGNTYGIKDDVDRAISDYSKAIELNPEYATAYNNRGIAYSHKSAYDRAIEDYNKAIGLNPEYDLAYNNRGTVYHFQKEYDRAIADYSQAIGLNPDYATAYNNRGNAYSHKGAYDRAIVDYSQAIGLNPDYATAYNNRGNAYRRKGAYDCL